MTKVTAGGSFGTSSLVLTTRQLVGSASTSDAKVGSPVRGLARLLRRNPTDAERLLWQALTRDRRFAGQFKRQTPVGRQIPDFVSFVHRLAIELVNPDESEAVVADRATRKTWLEQRGYRVIDLGVADIESDLGAQLDRLQASLSG